MPFERAPNHRGRSASGIFSELRDWDQRRRVRYTMCVGPRLFELPRYFELKTISLRFALQSFNIGYFELFPVSSESLKLACVTSVPVQTF